MSISNKQLQFLLKTAKRMIADWDKGGIDQGDAYDLALGLIDLNNHIAETGIVPSFAYADDSSDEEESSLSANLLGGSILPSAWYKKSR